MSAFSTAAAQAIKDDQFPVTESPRSEVKSFMTVDYAIRLFEKEDIDTVIEINQLTLPENYPSSFFMGLHSHAPKAFLVAVIDSKVIGYIMCRIERGISSFRKPYPVKRGHIVSVAVLRDYRRHGIGTQLVKKAMKAMEHYGASEFFLEVRKSNTPAVSAYEKMGFEVTRVLRGYYRDGEDAYLMAKQESDAKDEDSNV